MRKYVATLAAAVALHLLVPPAPMAGGTPIGASFDPPMAPPGAMVLVAGDPCDRQVGRDLIWFSGDIQGQPPYLAPTAVLGQAEGGLRSFVVPRLSPGRVTLVAQCSDCSGPCIQFGGWFTVLAAPDTATEPVGPADTRRDPWLPVFLAAAAAAGATLWWCRARSSRQPVDRIQPRGENPP